MDTKELNKIKKQAKKEFKLNHPTLLETIYQYSRNETIEVNSYNQVRYTFTLQPSFAFLAPSVNQQLNEINLSFELGTETYSATFVAE